MKKAFLLGIFMLVCSAACAAEAAPRETDNVDWLLMSTPDRIALTSKLVSELQGKGLPLANSPERYAGMITAVTDDPKIKRGTSIRKILMSIAYSKEPAVREVLNASSKKAKK